MLQGYAEALKVQRQTMNKEKFDEDDACFPLTEDLPGKQYWFDQKGVIYLKHGTVSAVHVVD